MTQISTPFQEASQSEFKEQLLRVRQITGASTQAEMAVFFNTTVYAVKAACRKRKIPAGWLLFLVMWRGINPEWILRGMGSYYFNSTRVRYETGEKWAARQQERKALSKIPSPALAEELLRRLCY